jgi:hypothetical protein
MNFNAHRKNERQMVFSKDVLKMAAAIKTLLNDSRWHQLWWTAGANKH